MQEIDYMFQMARNDEEKIEMCNMLLDKYLNSYVNVLFRKGETLGDLKRFDEAISVFKETLHFSGDDIAGRAHNSIGFCYSQKMEWDKAISHFEEAKKYSNNPLFLVNLAIAYKKLNQNEKALEIFKELKNSGYPLDEYKVVIEDLEHKVKTDQLFKDTLFKSLPEAFMQASIYSNMEDYENAIKVYDLITDRIPIHLSAWRDKAFAYTQL